MESLATADNRQIGKVVADKEAHLASGLIPGDKTKVCFTPSYRLQASISDVSISMRLEGEYPTDVTFCQQEDCTTSNATAW